MTDGMKKVLAAAIFAQDPRVQQIARTRGELRGVHPEGLFQVIGRAWDIAKEKPDSAEARLRGEAEVKAEEIGRMGEAILLEVKNKRGPQPQPRPQPRKPYGSTPKPDEFWCRCCGKPHGDHTYAAASEPATHKIYIEVMANNSGRVMKRLEVPATMTRGEKYYGHLRICEN